MLADICRQYETAATNPVFECRCLDVTPSSALKRDRDPGWLQVNISITDPSVTPTLRRHNPISPDLKSQTPALRTILPTWVQSTTQFKYREREGIERWSDLCENIGMFASQTDNNWLPGPSAQICLHPS